MSRSCKASRVALLLVLLAWRGLAAEPLPALGADASAVTVSGLSSGAYMAVQLQVAHSAVVNGAGALAGGPYYCAQGNGWTAYYNCMTPGWWTPLPAASVLRLQTEAFARAGQIDATSHLAHARAWLFTGTRDDTVSQDVVKALRDYYTLFGVDTRLVADQPAGHGMVTASAGGACGATASPYINDCRYDAAGELLKYLLGDLAPPSAKEGGALVRFDQAPFAGGDAAAIGLAAEGFAYIPRSCRSGRCRVHVAFHGCHQNAESVGERFVREAGYNRWADANRLIVLYPQTAASSFPLFNPRACWDWWGYTGALYATRDGAQIRAVWAMIERLAAQRP